MKSNKNHIVLLLLIIVTCALPLKSQQNPGTSLTNQQKAKTSIEQSLKFLDKSSQEKLSGNDINSDLYLQISLIKLNTAQSLLRSQSIKRDKDKLELELAAIRSKNFELKDKFKENISKLKEHKDKITLSEELLYNNAINNLETAQSDIETAEQVDATIYSSALLNDAHTYYKKAAESLEQGNYEQSATLSDKSIELAKQAYVQSKAKYEAKEELKNQFTNIFGFNMDNSSNVLILTSTDLFSPQSSSIRFDLYPSLDKIAGIIKDHHDIQIEIKAHNNSFKSRTKNKNLSKKQRDTIVGYLISKGIGEQVFINKDYSSKEITAERKVEIILNN